MPTNATNPTVASRKLFIGFSPFTVGLNWSPPTVLQAVALIPICTVNLRTLGVKPRAKMALRAALRGVCLASGVRFFALLC